MSDSNINKAERFIAEIEAIIASKLYKRVSNVTINNAAIKEAFSQFVSDVEFGKSFSLMDILDSAETVVKGRDVKCFAGYLICAFDADNLPKNRFAARLIRKSIPNVFNLISRVQGLSINVSEFMNYQVLRFLPVAPEKASKLLLKAQKYGIKIEKVGEVLSQNKIIVTENNSIITSYDTDAIFESEPTSISLNDSNFIAYKKGYDSVLSVMLCNSVAKNNLIRFPVESDFSELLAYALGYYSALTYHKSYPIKTVYISDSSIGVASARPNVADGDYLYFLKLRNDANGLTDKVHYGQLYYYMSEKKKLGIIKDVLPIRENIETVIDHLCGENLTFEPISSMPEGDYGIIVSVGRGESVNGIKLGYFRDN